MLAGITSKDYSLPSNRENYTREAVALGIVLAGLYNRDVLDPLRIWDRISSGLASACAKVQDGDVDRLISECIEHVKAEAGLVAAHDGLRELLERMSHPERDQAWRDGWVRHMSQRVPATIVRARIDWTAHKAVNKAGAR